MKIFITGSTGILSSALIGHLATKGHSLYCKKISLPGSTKETFSLPSSLNAFTKNKPLDAVIYPGEDIYPVKKWHSSTPEKIYNYQIRIIKYLAEHLATRKIKPKVFIVFSSVGFYGDRSDRILVETSFVGEDLHAEKCRQLEIATNSARQAGIRVILLRTSRIIGPHMDPFVQLYLPKNTLQKGLWGNGKQFVSWISTHDAVRAIEFAIQKDDISGPVNLTSPTPLSNIEFSNSLSLQDKSLIPHSVPSFMVRQLFDPITASILLASSRVLPKKLQVSGFTFVHPTLNDAVNQIKEQPLSCYNA
jgi:uncharacterized protein